MTPIHAHVESNGHTLPVGTLYSNLRRGTLTSTFSYGSDYLGSRAAYALEPAIPLNAGNWAIGRSLPRSFDDAAPDRWGRNLIEKQLRVEATVDGRNQPQLDDRDYLLGVSDETSQGALRFTTESGGKFQHPVFQHPSHGVPKLIALPALMRAADQVARNVPGDMSAIKTLLDAGTGSLGGARPKASIQDDGRLLIAKFPHHNDRWNVMAWEKTALDLAEAAGITVPPSQLLDVAGHSVLLVERFDRAHGHRIGYISALTLLEGEDGQARDYVEIAETIPEQSAHTSADLRELWRRIAFSIAIHNTDDHLRNHGFLRSGAGWSLAPAFDINPNPDPTAQRATRIGGASDAAGELQALVAYAPNFDLDAAHAAQILLEVAEGASGWLAAARRNGIAAAEIDYFARTLTPTIAAVAERAKSR